MTNEQPTKYPLLNEGDGNFTIMDVYTTNRDGNTMMSKKGFPMVKLSVNGEDTHGQSTLIYVYVSSNAGFLIDQLRKALNIKIPNDFTKMDWGSLVGYRGACIFETENSPGYPPKTKIKKFISLPEGVIPKRTAVVLPPKRLTPDLELMKSIHDDNLEPCTDDEIPF